jgi:hypothetical protein
MALQILKNTGATLQETFSAGAADGAVTITITRADGTALVTGATTTHGTGGVYTYQLAPQTELDLLTAVWSGIWGGVAQSISTQVEIIGGVLFPVSAARAFGDKVLADTTKYPDADIRETRERITDLFEQVCGVAFVPRYARDLLDGTGTSTIRVRKSHANRVIAASISGVALTSGDLAALTVYRSGDIVRYSGAWDLPSLAAGQNIAIAYEHGSFSPPLDIQRAGLVLARYELVSNDISDRMVSFDNDLGSVRLSVPGANNPTGLPIVDATLRRYEDSALLLA